MMMPNWDAIEERASDLNYEARIEMIGTLENVLTDYADCPLTDEVAGKIIADIKRKIL